MEIVKPRKFKVIVEYRSPYPDSIVFSKGEKVRIGQEFDEDPDWKNWISCEGKNNKKAWVPKQFLIINGINGILKRDYDARELSVKMGEILKVFEILNGFGMSEKINGERGWVPMKHLEVTHK
jgi:hypothetical protein